MATKAKGVIYIMRNGLNYFALDRTDVLKLDFPPTTTQDMEVVNKEELIQLLQNFITSNKILPSRSIIILSDNTFFQKDISIEKPEEVDIQTKLFLNNVPFEHVIFKIFNVEKAKRIVATNKDLYIYIKEYLEKNGFTIALVAAPLSLGKEFTLGDSITVDQAKAIIQKMDTIKPTESFLEQPKPAAQPEAEAPYALPQKKKKSKSTLPLLLPVFGLLIAVLVGVFYMQSKQDGSIVTQGAQVLSPFPTTPPASPTLEPTPLISSESAALQKKATKIQVLNGSRISGQAEKGRRDLTEVGYEDVQIGNADSTATSKTLIIFVKKVPDYIRNDIIAQLTKTYEEISTQETEQAEFDVIITLGNLIAAPATVTP